MLELYEIDEMLEGTFPIYFQCVDLYKREDPFLLEKRKCAKYEKGYFCGGRNTVELVT